MVSMHELSLILQVWLDTCQLVQLGGKSVFSHNLPSHAGYSCRKSIIICVQLVLLHRRLGYLQFWSAATTLMLMVCPACR